MKNINDGRYKCRCWTIPGLVATLRLNEEHQRWAIQMLMLDGTWISGYTEVE